MIDDEEIMEEEVQAVPLLLTMSQRDDLIGCLKKAVKWIQKHDLRNEAVWIGISGTDRTKPVHDNRVLGVWKNGIGNDYPRPESSESIALSPQRHALWYLQAVLDILCPHIKYSATWPNTTDSSQKRISGIHTDEDHLKEVIERLERK